MESQYFCAGQRDPESKEDNKYKDVKMLLNKDR